jgi:hypothetical protein
MKRLILFASLLLFVGSATTGCDRHIYGDSLSAQVVASGITRGDGYTWHATAGYTLEQWSSAVQKEAATKPAEIVLALGSNDAATWKADWGWTAYDEAVWSWTIASIPTATKVVVILPWFNPEVDAKYPGVRTEVDQARAFIRGLPSSRVDVIRDWKPLFEDQKSEDGIHIFTEDGIRFRHDITTGA